MAFELSKIVKNVQQLGQMLEAYDVPAILVSAQYEIIAVNKHYQKKFGQFNLEEKPKCFAVSHGYDKPCDQAGEDCPLIPALKSRKKERVLHIHQSPHGRENVNVEMIPIFDEAGSLTFFVELFNAVPLASGDPIKQKIVGESKSFKKLLATATRVASSDVNILLLGESGTGKELISQLIHLSSSRKNKPMVTLECAGLSESLIESELFGHNKGAFTGATTDKIGLVEYADKGTLFLDEIGDISLDTQVKLLRLIESKTFRRVGSTSVRTTDFRLICATHRNLKEMVAKGEFRLDLYHRINVFPISVPPLSERSEDIPQLVQHIIQTLNSTHNITDDALNLLIQQNFQGNIRELKNVINRAIILCDNDTIQPYNIKEALALDVDNYEPQSTVPKSLKEWEFEYLQNLLKKYDNKEDMAIEAGVSLRTLYRKLDNLAERS
jgi:transcriptional regulator with PAS, ATPase and Fis domain